ncbi:MAG: hypothetical protein ACQEP1_05660 [Nanobdellota archaeon]
MVISMIAVLGCGPAEDTSTEDEPPVQEETDSPSADDSDSGQTNKSDDSAIDEEFAQEDEEFVEVGEMV